MNFRDGGPRFRALLAERSAAPKRAEVDKVLRSGLPHDASWAWETEPDPEAVARGLLDVVVGDGFVHGVDVVADVPVRVACEAAGRLARDLGDAAWRIIFGGDLGMGVLHVDAALAPEVVQAVLLIDGEELWFVAGDGSVILVEVDRDVEPNLGTVRGAVIDHAIRDQHE